MVRQNMEAAALVEYHYCGLKKYAKQYTVEPLLSAHLSKLRTPLLSRHHLGNRLGGKGCHLAHAYRKVTDCKSWNHLFDH